jgi:hypothetical protein
LILSIFLFTHLIIFLSIGLAYQFEGSLSINGTQYYYGDPEYMNFFNVFFIVMIVSLGVLVILFLYFLFSQKKLYIVMDKNSTDYTTFYYIHDRKNKELIYLTEGNAIIYNQKYDSVRVEDHEESVNNIFNRFIFWHNFDKLDLFDEVKVIVKNKKTVLKYRDKSQSRFGAALHTRLTFSENNYIVPSKVTEVKSYRMSGNVNIKSMITYYFEDINQRQYIDIHPEIKRYLTNTY